MNTSTKVIVTNIAALRSKHGTKGTRKIQTALSRLIKADKKRGVTTEVIAIDRASDMKDIGKRVTSATNRRQTKRAIDAIYAARAPHYIMILGAPDVVPHQLLTSPMYDPPNDPDAFVESDLPYACEAAYSRNIQDFLGPTRVVGRLPDITGVRDPDHLVGLLNTASSWKRKPAASYRRFFGLSAESWRQSTRTSIRKLFGSSKGVRLSPEEGPFWSQQDLSARVHFINCHGDTRRPEFYGENKDDEYDQPEAHLSGHLRGRVKSATVVAAECCYSAELYNPGNGMTSICQTYLAEGAWAFFGSTTIAYGPAEGNNQADLLCGFFLKAVLEGASVGRAALMARQKYIGIGSYMEPSDLKTIAQFVLLGDPFVHPVKAAPVVSKTRSKSRTGSKAKRRARTQDPRAHRRKLLQRTGGRLASSTASVASRADTRATPGVRERLRKICENHQMTADPARSFRLRAAQRTGPSAVAKSLSRGHTIFHMLSETAGTTAKGEKRPQVQPHRVLIVREVSGRIEKVVEIHKR